MGWYRAAGGVLAILYAFSLQAGAKKKKTAGKYQQRASAASAAVSIYPAVVYLESEQNGAIEEEVRGDISFYPKKLQVTLNLLKLETNSQFLTTALEQVDLMLKGKARAPWHADLEAQYIFQVPPGETPASMEAREKHCVVTALLQILPHLTKLFSRTWEEEKLNLQLLKDQSGKSRLGDEKWDKAWSLLKTWMDLYRRVETLHREKLHRIASVYLLRESAAFFTPHITIQSTYGVPRYQEFLQPHERIFSEFCGLLQLYSNAITASDSLGWNAIYKATLYSRLFQAILSPVTSSPSVSLEHIRKTHPKFIELEAERRTHVLLPKDFDISNFTKILDLIAQFTTSSETLHIKKIEEEDVWAQEEDQLTCLKQLRTKHPKPISSKSEEEEDPRPVPIRIEESAPTSPITVVLTPKPQWDFWHQEAVRSFSQKKVVEAETYFLQSIAAAEEAEVPSSKQLELEYCLLDFYMTLVFDPRFHAVDPTLLQQLIQLNGNFFHYHRFPDRKTVDVYFEKIQQFLKGKPYFEKAQASMRRCNEFSEVDWLGLPAGLDAFVSETLAQLAAQQTAYTPAYIQALCNEARQFVHNRTEFIFSNFPVRKNNTNPPATTHRTHDLLQRLKEIESTQPYDESIVHALLQKTRKPEPKTRKPEPKLRYPRSWKSIEYAKSAEAPN